MSYIMESFDEARRLLAQESANPSRARLLKAGLQPGMYVLDAGCGSGAVTHEIAGMVRSGGRVVGIDPSAERLDAARAHLRGFDNVELQKAGLPDSGLNDGEFDFCWCQFVFEYLADPEAAARELLRVTRPGGRVAIAEIDGYGLGVWPTTASLDDGIARLQVALRSARFDLFAGRKIFTLLRRLGVRDVKVELSTFHVTPGTADPALIEDWRIRLAALEPIAVSTFETAERWKGFVGEYLALLADPLAFKYAVVLTTVGTRA